MLFYKQVGITVTFHNFSVDIRDQFPALHIQTIFAQHTAIKKGCQIVRTDVIVAVNETQPFTLGCIYPVIACRAYALVCLVEYLYAFVLYGIPVTDEP